MDPVARGGIVPSFSPTLPSLWFETHNLILLIPRVCRWQSSIYSPYLSLFDTFNQTCTFLSSFSFYFSEGRERVAFAVRCVMLVSIDSLLPSASISALKEAKEKFCLHAATIRGSLFRLGYL